MSLCALAHCEGCGHGINDLPTGQELVVEAAHGGVRDESTEVRYRNGEGIIGSVLKTGRVEIVPRISQEPRYRNRIHRRHPQESEEAGFLCVPIVLEGEVVGTLSADVPAEDEHDLEEQARVLEIVASLIALDVRTRRLARVERQTLEDEKGAFTGELSARVGRIEEAEGGTLFLDEIGDFSPTIQVKLLRVLQEREYERMGSNLTTKADVRILAATNKDLDAAVSAEGFRQDLYYRVNVLPIILPPL